MQPKKILFIDDDRDVLDLIPVILEKENIAVQTYTDISIITSISALKPDLIVLDEWLPGKSGSRICAELKSDSLTAHIPVILMSAVIGLEKITADCKADAFICKPFDIDQLIHVICQVLNIPSSDTL